MNALQQALIEVAADLDRLDARWALVGGFALAVRAEPRVTRDIDLAVVVADDEDAQALIHALTKSRYRIVWQFVREASGELASVRLDVPGRSGADAVVVDLLLASSGIEDEVVESAELVDVMPGTKMPVVTSGHLLALKALANRPKDRLDALQLLKQMGPEEIQRARLAVERIQRRGFERNVDVAETLEELIKSGTRSERQ